MFTKTSITLVVLVTLASGAVAAERRQQGGPGVRVISPTVDHCFPVGENSDASCWK